MTVACIFRRRFHNQLKLTLSNFPNNLIWSKQQTKVFSSNAVNILGNDAFLSSCLTFLWHYPELHHLFVFLLQFGPNYFCHSKVSFPRHWRRHLPSSPPLSFLQKSDLDESWRHIVVGNILETKVDVSRHEKPKGPGKTMGMLCSQYVGIEVKERAREARNEGVFASRLLARPGSFSLAEMAWLYFHFGGGKSEIFL